MPTNFVLTLDTTGPAGVTADINAGAAYATARDVSLAVASSDPDLTGYQVKIWGDVDAAANANIQTTEAASTWITLASPHAVRLAVGDGVKTLNVRVRDDVWNESAVATDTITLDTTLPVPNVSAGPTPAKISKMNGKRASTFTFSVPDAIQAYKVKVVPSASSLENAGTQIGVANGSANMTGGAVAANTAVNCTIDGADLEAASAGDGAKTIKVFVQDQAGNWSL